MAITKYLNQSVNHYARATYDKYGRETDAATPTAYKARVQEVTKQRLLPNGEVATIDALCFINEDPAISMDDRIDYAGTRYRVFGIKKNVDGQGSVHHTTFELQKVVG